MSVVAIVMMMLVKREAFSEEPLQILVCICYDVNVQHESFNRKINICNSVLGLGGCC